MLPIFISTRLQNHHNLESLRSLTTHWSYVFDTHRSHLDGCTNTTVLFIFTPITRKTSRRLHQSMIDTPLDNRSPQLSHNQPALVLAHSKGPMSSPQKWVTPYLHPHLHPLPHHPNQSYRHRHRHRLLSPSRPPHSARQPRAGSSVPACSALALVAQPARAGKQW